MSERLEQLEARWQADPNSRIFLQLAEEYRRLGRAEEGIPVLERGLEHHRNWIAAQVCLGRCRLETERHEGAAACLEAVVRKDPTQLVAYRLLVEAYLGLGDATSARERLELYRDLNPEDPQIQVLENRLEPLVANPPAEPVSAPAPPGLSLDPRDLDSVDVEPLEVEALDVHDEPDVSPAAEVAPAFATVVLSPEALADAKRQIESQTSSAPASFDSRRSTDDADFPAPVSFESAGAPDPVVHGDIADRSVDLEAETAVQPLEALVAADASPLVAASDDVSPDLPEEAQAVNVVVAPEPGAATPELLSSDDNTVFAVTVTEHQAPDLVATLLAPPPRSLSRPGHRPGDRPGGRPGHSTARASRASVPPALSSETVLPAQSALIEAPSGQLAEQAAAPFAPRPAIGFAHVPEDLPSPQGATRNVDGAEDGANDGDPAADEPVRAESPGGVVETASASAPSASGLAALDLGSGAPIATATTSEQAQPAGAAGGLMHLPTGSAESAQAPLESLEKGAATVPGGERAVTSTLGSLYLDQGHPGDAQRIFEEVLEDNPVDPQARAGLERVATMAPKERTGRDLTASDLLEGHSGSPDESVDDKKSYALRSYLDRLKKPDDVS